ncbi:hypothetical protein N2152v2_002432 [Parachlorella kessleri]
MRALLISKGLWAAVESNTPNGDQDQKALAKIILSVKDHPLATVGSCATAKQAWETLKATYEAKSNARKLMLRRELTQLKMKPAEPLTVYAARAKDLQAQLRSAGDQVRDQEIALQFLAGLPPAFSMISTVLTSGDRELKIEEILPKLLPVDSWLSRSAQKRQRSLPNGGTAKASPGVAGTTAATPEPVTITFGNGGTGQAAATGEVRLHTADNEFLLTDVLYILEASENLISVRHATRGVGAPRTARSEVNRTSPPSALQPVARDPKRTSAAPSRASLTSLRESPRARHEDRPAFFTEALAAALPPDRPVLACGDWNFVPGEADVVGVLGAGSHRQVGALQFEEVQVGHGLVDAWRHLHPDGPGVTHVAANGTGSSAARLDRWYVAAPLLPWVRACDIVHGLPGDHLGVELVLQPPVTLPCGKGRWRLPLHLLQDKLYCTGNVDRVHGFLAAHPLQGAYDARQRWEGLKACITQFSMAHSLHSRAAATQQRRQLLQTVQAAQRAYSAHPTVPGLLHAYTAAQQRLQQHAAVDAGKRAAAASVLWHCYGEKPTKWFHSLGRKVMLHQPIPAVFDPLDREAPAANMSTPAGIAIALQRATSFFSADSAGGLFRPMPTDPAA